MIYPLYRDQQKVTQTFKNFFFGTLGYQMPNNSIKSEA